MALEETYKGGGTTRSPKSKADERVPMVAVYVRRSKEGDSPALLTELSQVDPAREDLLWLDLTAPSPEEIQTLGQHFPFHHLALEDATKQHQRPKIDSYGDYDFLTFYVLRYQKGAKGLEKPELGLFVGKNYVVTVHKEPLEELEDARQRWNTQQAIHDENGVGFLVYTILDTVVDSYFPIVDALGDEIDEMEDQLFKSFNQSLLQRALLVRKCLLDARRIMSPERDILSLLSRTEQPFFDPAMVFYFTDVYDHLIWVNDAVDLQRDLLASLLEGYQSLVSNSLNQVMKVLTAVAIILMALALLTGIYGMNFAAMPGLDWEGGFGATILAMVVVAVLLTFFFKRKGWL